MFSRKPSIERLPDIQNVAAGFTPAPVVHAHKEITRRMNRQGGQAPARLPRSQYGTVDTFNLGGHVVEVGNLEGVQPGLGAETTKYVFELAAHIGSVGLLEIPRFHIPTQKYESIQVALDAPQHDSFIVYGKESKLAASRRNGSGGSAYTTGRTLIGKGATSVSFVGVPASGPTTETRMAAGTEIMQNRMHVVSVLAAEHEQPDTNERHTGPFQEAIANGMGNVIGQIAAGSTYKDYKNYVHNTHNTLATWGYDLPADGGMVAAPHLVATKALYEQVMDRELPTIQNSSFTPLMPRVN